MEKCWTFSIKNVKIYFKLVKWRFKASYICSFADKDYTYGGKNLAKKFIKLSPGRIIALGFLAAIMIGSGLLMLPCSIRDGQTVKYIDALYTSASAVCVTGLTTVDPGVTFTPIGQFFIALLIQIGGLGLTTIGAGVMLIAGKRIGLGGRNLIKEAGNLDNGRDVIRFVKSVLFTTLAIELVGAALSFIVFVQEYSPIQAIGYSLFHSVATFNNSGCDIFVNPNNPYSNDSMVVYHDNILLNLITVGLIILGGIGFLVIREIKRKGIHWKKYSMHAKVVISVSAFLIVVGTLLIKLTETDESWLSALFHSVSTRTAGFSTTDIGSLSPAGLLVIMVLMFIGASPGSTGGGIKTTTVFVLFCGIISAATNRSEKAFKYSIPKNLFRKAAVITLLALALVLTSTWLLLIFEPDVSFLDALFEMTSAFGTVGLSTGITSALSTSSKLLSILMMYIGRLGPLTIASLWYFTKGERVKYPEGYIAVG